jgi:hypothetical protein
MSRLRQALFLMCIAALLVPPAAQAAYPGENGMIAYTLLVDPDPTDGVTTGQTDIFTITPGTFIRTNITNSPDFETNASWSPTARAW